MKRFRFVAYALAALVPALQAGAQDAIQDSSPSADIQPVAPLSQTVATGAVLEHPFAVRIVDRSGHHHHHGHGPHQGHGHHHDHRDEPVPPEATDRG